MSDAAPRCSPGLGRQAAAAGGSEQGDGEATMHTAVGQLTYRRAVSKKLVRSTWCDGRWHARPVPASVANHPPTQHVLLPCGHAGVLRPAVQRPRAAGVHMDGGGGEAGEQEGCGGGDR